MFFFFLTVNYSLDRVFTVGNVGHAAGVGLFIWVVVAARDQARTSTRHDWNNREERKKKHRITHLYYSIMVLCLQYTHTHSNVCKKDVCIGSQNRVRATLGGHAATAGDKQKFLYFPILYLLLILQIEEIEEMFERCFVLNIDQWSFILNPTVTVNIYITKSQLNTNE